MSTLKTQKRFNFPGQKSFYQGKVRDVYNIDGDFLIMIVSDRISAFDVILPRTIPFKGQVLNQIAAKFLDATSDIIPNWKIKKVDPNITIGWFCEPFKVEMVIYGYLTGHAWREYRSGKRIICGISMPDGMKENDKFPEPIITPTIKDEKGYDIDITREEIISSGLVDEAHYFFLEDYTRKLFQRGIKMATERGLILVDTKYKFGKKNGKIYLIDEIHTPDSSRYFYFNDYEKRKSVGEKQRHLSKEFIREWLINSSFEGKEGQVLPLMNDSIIKLISKRYIELYEKITGDKFIALPVVDLERELIEWIDLIRQINRC